MGLVGAGGGSTDTLHGTGYDSGHEPRAKGDALSVRMGLAIRYMFAMCKYICSWRMPPTSCAGLLRSLI